MTYRGRLIFPFQAELHRLDTYETAQDPDGTGPLDSGYDIDFREPIHILQSATDQVGETTRVEKPPIKVVCQIETDAFESLQQFASGQVPSSHIKLVFHYDLLEKQGLIDVATGDALIRIGDRLGAIYDIKNNLVQEIANPPGLFVVEAKPIGFGLNMAHPHRNLLLVSFTDREQGVET